MDRRDVPPAEIPGKTPEDHATTGGATAAGAATGAVAGAATGAATGSLGGPVGAIGGAVGGAILGAGAERVMHHDTDPRAGQAPAHVPEPDRRYAEDTQASQPLVTGERGAMSGAVETLTEGERVIELREEQLVAQKDMRDVGNVHIRKEIEEFPGRLEVQAHREEVEVEHVPVGDVVTEKVAPWEENGVVVVPVYEEQMVVVKRLVLREHLRIRRIATTETQYYEDTLRRERLIIDDPVNSGLVHEQFDTRDHQGEVVADTEAARHSATDHEQGGFLEKLVRKALQ